VATRRLLSFSPRKQPTNSRLSLAFQVVRRFVSRAKPALAWTKLNVGCREIVLFRKMNRGKIGDRSLMHAFHKPNTICSLSLADHLPEGYVFGLLLHEFGHCGSGGGEREADRWIFDNFGIRIQYLGSLDLEWVDHFAINRIMKASTPPRPRRNPHPSRRRNPRHHCPRPRHPRATPSDPRL
jgi:hypothetical protein